MSFDVKEYIENADWLLADGATGTNLFNMGLEAGEAPELWNVDQPEKIKALYQLAVDAGSDIFLTNSFGGTAARLKLHNAQNRIEELNVAAAKLAREIADASGRRVLVAGSMGPTGEILEPVGTFPYSEAVRMFKEQGAALLKGGVDLLWVETISAPEEYRAAAEAFDALGAPWCGTMSFDTAGRTMMGVTAPDMVKMVAGLKNPPIGFGANCGVGASDLLRTINGMVDADADANNILISKGNAGIPKYVEGHIHYDGTPELMAEYAVLARDMGAKIIGGCCGTMAEHLKAMRHALETVPRNNRPTLEMIETKMGGFSSKSDGTGAPPPKRERKGRRRPT